MIDCSASGPFGRSTAATRATAVIGGAMLDRRRFTVTNAPGASGFVVGTAMLVRSRSSVTPLALVCMAFKSACSSADLGRALGREDLPEERVLTDLSVGDKPCAG